MKISAAASDRFSRQPDPKCRAILLYGPDLGLVRERGLNLVKSVVDDPKDPFRVVEITGADLKNDPARLPDEAAALSFTGGRRVVRIRDAGDMITAAFKGFLQDPAGEALVVVEAADLPARSSLRQLFEGGKASAAVACYRDEQRNLQSVIKEALAEAGLEISPDALIYLSNNLGGDRQLTRRELEKLILYMGASGAEGERRRVEIEDAKSCIGDSTALTMEDLAFAVGDGNFEDLERFLTRCYSEGQEPIRILRSVARHFERLQLVAGLHAEGMELDGALKKLRPPLFWKSAAPFRSQVTAWTPAVLSIALRKLMATEAACKKTGAPSQTLTARTLFDLTRQGALARKRR
ncbi:MAG: DNA polymerase III subunit delta [Pseudomonadota bacterium]